MKDVYSDIIREITRRGGNAGQGCTTHELASFRERMAATPPREFVQLWSLINGTAPLVGSHVRLWSLAEIINAEDSVFRAGIRKGMWIIADYMAGTYAYALSVQAPGGAVYLVDGERVERVAATLEQFLRHVLLRD